MSTSNGLPRLFGAVRCKACCHANISRPRPAFSNSCAPVRFHWQYPSPRAYATAAPSENLPRIARPSLWTSLIPRSLRQSSSPKPVKSRSNQEWNPATFYIVMFMLIGSQAIQTIALRTEYAAFSRRADARIALLREVIERVNKGEEVDVEGLLGTEDEQKEKEWEEVLREIEEEDRLWQDTAKRRQRRHKVVEDDDDLDDARAASEAALAAEDRSPMDTSPERSGNSSKDDGKPVQAWFR